MTSADQTATRAGGRHGRPWRAAGAVVVVLLAMVGTGMLGASFRSVPPPRPPQPLAQPGQNEPTTAAATPSGAAPVAATPSGAAPAGTAAPVEPAPDIRSPAAAVSPGPAALSRAVPTSISIPRIGVDADILALGTNPDGTVQVPPLDQAMKAGWYSPGPSPGETGNAVIVGHVDSAKLGPAVFFRLGALVKGDTIRIARANGGTATFRVDEVKSYPKTDFPTDLVYGPGDRPGLRVVTCGGAFDRNARSYVDNVIVFATLAA
jgi:sortase (surface protein transpeptidase)